MMAILAGSVSDAMFGVGCRERKGGGVRFVGVKFRDEDEGEDVDGEESRRPPR